MDVRVKVYQLSGASVTAIKGGHSAGQVAELEADSVSGVKKFLEGRATEFRMGEVSVKTEHLPEGFFTGYEPYEPYVLEAQVGSAWDASDSRCIFYGPVQKKSINYSHRSGTTSFTAMSWDKAIGEFSRGTTAEDAAIIARDRIPVITTKPWARGGASGPTGQEIHVVGNQDIGPYLNKGSTLVIDAQVGEKSLEYRFIAASDGTDTGETVSGFPVYKFKVFSGIDDFITIGPSGGLLPPTYVRFDVNQGYDYFTHKGRILLDPEAWDTDIDSLVGAEIEVEVGGEKHVRRVEDATRGARESLDGPEGDPNTNVVKDAAVVLTLSEYIQYAQEPSEADWSAATVTFYRQIRVGRGEQGRLLSDAAYGAGGGTVDPYDAPQLVEGIATRTPGLADVMDPGVVVNGVPATISRYFDFDDDPLRALGDIQRSGEFFVFFLPRKGTDGTERIGGSGARRVKVVIATRAYLASQAAITLPAMTEWQGEALGKRPKGVVVRGPEPVNAVSEGKAVKGWYPDGVLSVGDEPNENELVVVEAPHVRPVQSKEKAFELPDNNPSLRGRAKRYFDIYKHFFRKQTVEIPEVFDVAPSGTYWEPVVGRVASGSAETVEKTGLVVSQEVDYQAERTTLELLVSEGYAAPVNALPVALLAGGKYLPDEGGGAATARFDASSSYDPNGDPVYFTWLKNGAEIAGETGRLLETTVTDGDVIKVEVRDGTGDEVGSGSSDWYAERVVTVFPAGSYPNSPADPPLLIARPDANASDLDKQVFEVAALKPSAEIALTYRIMEAGAQVESGQINAGFDEVTGSLTVPRPETGSPSQLKIKTVHVRAVDLSGGIESAEQTFIVEQGIRPRLDSVTGTRDGEDLLIGVELHPEQSADGFDLQATLFENQGTPGDNTETILFDEHDVTPTSVDELGWSGRRQIGQVASNQWVNVTVKPYADFSGVKLYGGATYILLRYDSAGSPFIIKGVSSVRLAEGINAPTINTTVDGAETTYEISLPQGLSPSDTPEFSGVKVGSGGLVKDDGAGAVGVYDAAGTALGTLLVKDLIVEGTVDQRNTTELNVEDQYIRVNRGQTGTPSLDGGIVAERGDQPDAYLEWNEAQDTWGTRVGAGAFKPLLDVTYDEGTNTWVIAGHVKVSGEMHATGDVQAYSDGPGTSTAPLGLTDLSGVNVSSPVSGDVLQYNGSEWVNVDGSGLSDGGGQWTENGSNIYFSGGNVGIGTSAPSATLHVDGTAQVNESLRIYRNGTHPWILNHHDPHIYGADNAGSSYPFDNLGHLVIQPRTSADRDIIFAVRSSSTGNTRPAAAILGGNGDVMLMDDASEGNGVPRIGFSEALEPTGSMYIEYDGDNLGGDANRIAITDESANPLAVFQLGGNVGIGTATPTSLLHVAGDIELDGRTYHNGWNTYQISGLNASGTQAKRYEIARIGYNSGWSRNSYVYIYLDTDYYQAGYKKYLVTLDYDESTGRLMLLEAFGHKANEFKVSIAHNPSSNYLSVYVDVDYYHQMSARVETQMSVTSDSTPSEGDLWIDTTPSATNISSFSDDNETYDLECTRGMRHSAKVW